MADGTQDRIDIALGADTSGLDDAERRSISFLDRYEQRVVHVAQDLPPLNLDTSLVSQKLTALEQQLGGARLVIPPPNFSEFIAETIHAADVVRTEFVGAFPTQALGIEAKQAATIAADELQSGLLARIGTIRDEVATGLISPAAFRQQADLALEAFSQEIVARQARLPELVLRVRGTGQQDTGVITDANLREVAAFDQVTASAAGAAGATTQLAATVRAEGAAAKQSAADNDAAAVAIGGVGTAAEQVGAHTVAASRGLNLMRGGAVALAAQTIGVSGSLGTMSTGLLFLSGIAPEVVIGLAGIVLAMEAFEKPTREAREATDKLIQSLEQAAEARRPDFTQMADQIAEVRAQSEAATDRIAKLQAQAAAQGKGGALIFGTDLREEADRLGKLQTALQQLIPLQAQLQQQATSGKGTTLIADLGLQLATFGQSSEAIQRYRLSLETGMTEPQRKAAIVLLDLIEKQRLHAEAARDAAKAVEAEGLSIEQTFANAVAAVDNAIATLGRDPFADLVAKQQKATAAQLGNIALPTNTIPEAFDRATASVDDVQVALLRAIAASNRFGARAVQNADDTRTANQRLADSISEVVQGLGGILNAAGSIGLIGDEAANAIGSVLQLADALSKVAESASTGNVLGAIGAGIGAIGAIFGPGQGDRAREQAIRDNTEQLRLLRQDLTSGAALGVRGQATIGRAAAFLGSDQSGTTDLIASQARFIQFQTTLNQGEAQGRAAAFSFLDQQVEQFGLTFADLQRVAKENGIQLLDSKGNLVASAFDKLAESTGITIAAMTQFGDSFDEQLRRTNLQSQLQGLPQDATSAFARELAAAAKSSSGVAQAFAGVDPNDRAAVRDAALKLFDQFDTGFFTLHPELLGSLSKDDFLRFLDDTNGFLNQFSQGLQSATRNLQNVPDIVTLAEQEFAARSPINRPGDGSSLPPFGGTDLNPRVPGVDFARRFGASQSVTINGPVNVIVQGIENDAEGNARAIMAAIVRTRLATTGREEDPSL